MHSATISMLLPIEKKVPYYEAFVLQYSLVISSNLIVYNLIENETDKKIFELFEDFHGEIDDYNLKSILMRGIGLEDNAPQRDEQRGLLLDKLFLSMSIDKKTPKFILESFMNLKEFLLLYSIFEGVLKNEFTRSGVLPSGKFLKEKDLIGYIKKKVSTKENDFIKYLAQRSPLGSFNDLEIFWDYYTHFRHLFFHSGGYVTTKWLQNFEQKKAKLRDTVDKFLCPISSLRLSEILENIEIVDSKMFYMTDEFSNIFRNLVISIMESLYQIEDV